MAELATLARPYAEALFKSAGGGAPALKAQLASLAALAGNPELLQYAGDPKVPPNKVVDLIESVARERGVSLDAKVAELLRAIVENGRLSALPEVSAQYQALLGAQSGVSEATIHSAFPIDDAQLRDVAAALEQRFGRKLHASVVVDPGLIGGIRAVVGDEVLDTSVKARLEQMRAALTA